MQNHRQTLSKIERTFPSQKLVILYNRVPKCGSSLNNKLLEMTSYQGKRYFFFKRRKFENFSFPESARQSLINEISADRGVDIDRAWVYSLHFHYVQFPPTQRLRFEYINHIRDPIKRTLSQYAYVRAQCFSLNKDARCDLGHKKLRDVTLEECLTSIEISRCTSPEYGVSPVIPFFSGPFKAEMNISSAQSQEAALALAKKNIEKHYSYIGILEHMEQSLELLEHIYPSLFSGIRAAYLYRLNKSRVYKTPVRFRQTLSNKSMEILRSALKYEYDLYYFILKQFANDYRQAFNRDPLN